jgi:hypothetical protein
MKRARSMGCYNDAGSLSCAIKMLATLSLSRGSIGQNGFPDEVYIVISAFEDHKV